MEIKLNKSFSKFYAIIAFMKQTTMTVTIDFKTKKALTEYCKKHGKKIQHVVEEAILQTIEDEIDLEAIQLREDEDVISFEEVIKSLK